MFVSVVLSRMLGGKTYDLKDAAALDGSRERLLAFRIYHPRETGWTNEERDFDVVAEDGAAGVDGGNVLQYSWSEPNAFVHCFVLIATPAVGRGCGIECVCLG